MRRVRRLLNLAPGDRALLVRAAFLVSLVRSGLWILPFDFVRRVVLRPRRQAGKVQAAKLIWAVKVVSPYLPQASCLTQALAAQALLAVSGYPSRIEVGVAKESEQSLAAHAWLVFEERVVLGGPDVNRYVPLAAWEGKSNGYFVWRSCCRGAGCHVPRSR